MVSVPTASIVIPTRDRPDYLAVALASIAPQARAAGAEVIVVDDGNDEATASVATAGGARLVLSRGRGANAARNAGISAAQGDLLVLLDDDVDAPSGWLEAVLAGVDGNPDHGVFGGPIRARLEGGGPSTCGRESPPITTLDHGLDDRDVPLVWSANMAIRRSALDRVGTFDESIHGRGEEEEWERRYAATGGRIRYLSGAGIDHRRSAADARLTQLTRAAFTLGRSARRYDERQGQRPSLPAELRTLAGCLWHIVRRRCAGGIILAGHASGRLREALAGRGVTGTRT
jgi:glycosyltransferase involved in cell wall biosynthesis